VDRATRSVVQILDTLPIPVSISQRPQIGHGTVHNSSRRIKTDHNLLRRKLVLVREPHVLRQPSYAPEGARPWRRFGGFPGGYLTLTRHTPTAADAARVKHHASQPRELNSLLARARDPRKDAPAPGRR
jgi:hypothetical protein